ncbi:hydrogenase maturation nickel metallochaperone HypA [Cyanobium sp. CH-040]|uniref:hydrogenase maturation nickel metallochaperone HypA/HybF n=1 Tax=Cyanobium sp. CH-040 TaxID=2823708 RepID=UPI0020CF09D1|nr:hydrogenase maturation nickel metallochaperone HypA [Cyanobium sp. CH-040]MCP9927533.1 hydrogenase maturation nickel metallochaperone HypA [Cyanobium sp. CH-040]
MHEVDMTKCLLLSMNAWKQQHAPHTPQVERVHLQVGAFTCVEPDQLVTTWRVAVQGSWLDGADLAIETVPLVGRCLICNSTYSPDPRQAYRSPCCDHPMEEIVSGRELRIRSVDYLLRDPTRPSRTAAAR